MTDGSTLTDDFLRQLMSVGEVDILVGLATHNNAKTVGPVVEAIQAGILRYFPRERTVIVNADGGSRDGTQDLITKVSIDDARPASNLRTLRTLHSISTPYRHGPDGSALRTILAAAELLRANAVVVISPESVNIEPEWMPRLLRPIYDEKADLVLPLYRRHKFEGMLVTNLIYPMTRSVYGWNAREPYASEYSFSGRLGSDFLSRDIWSDELVRSSPELHLTVAAMTGRYSLCQSFLGSKASLDRKWSDLVPAMLRTVGVLFWSLEPNFAYWRAGAVSRPVPAVGEPASVSVEPVRINRKRLYEMFRFGVAELESVLSLILSPSTFMEVRGLTAAADGEFRYPAQLWVKTVYEFAAAYHKGVMNINHIVQALAPLFRGRMFSFLAETRDSSSDEIECNIESLCAEFERQRPYLLEIWTKGEGGKHAGNDSE